MDKLLEDLEKDKGREYALTVQCLVAAKFAMEMLIHMKADERVTQLITLSVGAAMEIALDKIGADLPEIMEQADRIRKASFDESRNGSPLH